MGIRTTALSGLQHLASAMKLSADRPVTPSSGQFAPSKNRPKALDHPLQRWTDAGPRSRLMKMGVKETLPQKNLKGKDDDGLISAPPLGAQSRKSVTFSDNDDVKVFDNTEPVLDISTPRKKVTFEEENDVRPM